MKGQVTSYEGQVKNIGGLAPAMDYNEIISCITCGDCRWHRAWDGCCRFQPEPRRSTDEVCAHFDLHPINGEGYGLTLGQCRQFMAEFHRQASANGD